MGPDFYRMHQKALIPLKMQDTEFSPARFLEDMNQLNLPEFAAFVRKNGLSGLWQNWLEGCSPHAVCAEFSATVAIDTRRTIAMQLAQEPVLRQVSEILNDAETGYFLAKGAILCRTIYSKPWMRPFVDIDLFVKKDDKERVTRLLLGAGFEALPLPETLSHELKLRRANADVDLHWHVLRPGRYRPGLMNWLFENRKKSGPYWGLNATAHLFLMLVHPPITKYLISPTSMLIHQADQTRLIASGKVDWNELEKALNRSGIRTAAWSSLYLLRRLTQIEAPEGFEQRIRPAKAKAWYLQQWIDQEWITRFFGQQWLVKGFFNLALQDTLADMARALIQLRKSEG